jgi:hypothetical protein
VLLEERGWRMEAPIIWRETLELTLSDALLERWFGEGAEYRRMALATGSGEPLEELERQLRRRRGGRLPQPLEHRLLGGRLGG